MIIMSFLHWTTKSLCRRGGDSCAFKCEKDTWCAHSVESFVRGDSSVLRTPVHLLNLLCKMMATVDIPPTVNSTKQLLSPRALLSYPQKLAKRSFANHPHPTHNLKSPVLAHEAVMSHCLSGSKENLCKCLVIATTYLLLLPMQLCEIHRCCGQMWIVMFYFSYIGNQVWYVLTGANFMHITCLLWVRLSPGLTTTPALAVRRFNASL